MVVITDSGRVDQRIVELGDVIDEHQLSQLREMLGQALDGKQLSAASVAVADLADQFDGARQSGRRRRPLGDGAAGVAGRAHRRTAAAGRHRQPDPQHRRLRRFAASILEALEEQVVVLRLLAAQQEAGKVTVRIGHETEAEQMVGTSVVSTAYGTAGHRLRRDGRAGAHPNGLSGNYR